MVCSFKVSEVFYNMEGQESSGLDTHEGKLQKYLDLCTHPDVCGFDVKSHVYT